MLTRQLIYPMLHMYILDSYWMCMTTMAHLLSHETTNIFGRVNVLLSENPFIPHVYKYTADEEKRVLSVNCPEWSEARS
jgi:hypothetical protein